MEDVSPAIIDIYGIEPEAIVGKVEKWAAVIVSEDREVALPHIGEARRGVSVVNEFRIERRSHHTFRLIRNIAFSLEVNGHVHRVGGIAERATVFEGAICMTGKSDLTDRRILGVQEDYYLATDTA